MCSGCCSSLENFNSAKVDRPVACRSGPLDHFEADEFPVMPAMPLPKVLILSKSENLSSDAAHDDARLIVTHTHRDSLTRIQEYNRKRAVGASTIRESCVVQSVS